MPDAFFVSKKTRKRKRSSKPKEVPGSKKQVNGKGRPDGKTKRRDEELDSDATEDDIDDLDLRASESDPAASGEEDELETPAEKRLRLAKVYLDSLKEGLADGEVDAAELDREIIASRLRQDVMDHSGKIHKFIADSLAIPAEPLYLRTRGHRGAVTSAVASSSGRHLYTSGKEGNIVQTDLSTGKSILTFYKVRLSTLAGGKGKEKEKAPAEVQGHTDEVLALALSDDGKVLASGGKDRKLVVWDAENGKWLRSFVGHKDTISCLAFRKGTHQLYTGSLDRTLKLFELSPNIMGYVDTLFGHQDHVVDLDALRAETAVSVGARDRTVRFWKVVDETQLVFRGGSKSKIREVLEGGLDSIEDEDTGDRKKDVEKRYEEGSLDCVALIDETTFVSGGDSGSIAIWVTAKKKPIFTQPLAHGMHEVYSETEGIVATPRWITALACLRYGDVLASGSWSGEIRLWKIAVDGSKKSHSLSLALIGTLPAPGIVNSLQVLSVPSSRTDSWTWLANKRSNAGQNGGEVNGGAGHATKKGKADAENTVVVAGLGQEPRLGRWITMKGNGAANGSRVFVLGGQK